MSAEDLVEEFVCKYMTPNDDGSLTMPAFRTRHMAEMVRGARAEAFREAAAKAQRLAGMYQNRAQEMGLPLAEEECYEAKSWAMNDFAGVLALEAAALDRLAGEGG